MFRFFYKIVSLSVLLLSVSCSKDHTGNSGGSDTHVRDYELNPKVISIQHKETLPEFRNEVFGFTMEQYVFEYTSVGPDLKTPVRLTGVISMTPGVFSHEVKPMDVMFYHEYTNAKHGERQSQNEVDNLMMFLNNLHPSIAICADLYGWTLTEDKPQAYMCTDVTSVESIDCWDAAMQILKEKGYDITGLPLFNVGYSSGALSAMGLQRHVDKYRPDIEFEGTIAGGGPFDIEAIYKDYIETNTTGYICSIPLMLVAYKETYNLPYSYSDMFYEPLAGNIDEWILSKNYTTWDINYMIGIDKKVNEVLKPQACNFDNPSVQALMKKFRENSVCGPGQDWQPNKNTKFYIYHTTEDLYITYKVGVEMADYLESKGCKVERTFIDNGNHVYNGMLYWTALSLYYMTGIVYDFSCFYS